MKPPLDDATTLMSAEDDAIWWHVIVSWRRHGLVMWKALEADRRDYELMMWCRSYRADPRFRGWGLSLTLRFPKLGGGEPLYCGGRAFRQIRITDI